jgi:ATP-dependent DNA ligase
MLERLVTGHPRILYARHIEHDGSALFKLVCEQDLESIVGKRRDGAYGQDWFKIRNPKYSQYVGRQELFEKRVGRKRDSIAQVVDFHARRRVISPSFTC